MPASPAYAGTWRSTLIWTLPNTDVAENVLHWAVVPALDFTTTSAQSLSDQIQTVWGSSTFKGIVNTGVKLHAIKVEDLRTTPYASRTFTIDSAGSDSSTAMPWQNAACVSLHTTHAGRTGRGRVFLPGLCEDSNDTGGVISSTSAGYCKDFIIGIAGITTVDSEDVIFSVLSRKDAAVYDVDAVTCDTRWDTQRRRANRRIS